jgi:DNA-binding transcriptional LysR family regulator
MVAVMPVPDLNLLVTLDVLLAEGSVARAARRLRLSPSAMSRALARLREATGDPLLVRAGRGLVPTPRALELGERVGRLVQDGQEVLRPAETIELSQLVRTFTLRTSEGFVENFGPALISRVGQQAPGVRLRFVPKADKDSASLRNGTVDLETGVVGQTMGPATASLASFARGTLGATAKSRPPAMPAADTSSSRGRALTRGRSTKLCKRWGWNGGSLRSSAALRPRWRSPGPPI